MTAVGDILDEWDFTVEKGKVREFARAVQDPHGMVSNIAPPTFPVVASAAFVEKLIDRLGLDRTRTVHGEHTYEYAEPIKVGDTLHCVARMASDETKAGKRGGTMRMITTEVAFTSARTGRTVCRETMLSIEKGAVGS